MSRFLSIIAVSITFTLQLPWFSGHADAAFPLLRSASNGDIRSFIGADSGHIGKIVFVNTTDGADGQLCYMDLSEEADTPAIHMITAAPHAKVPVISPDGKWVTYATGEGGEAGKSVDLRSSIWICKIAEDATPVLVCADSAAEPRFMQNVPANNDTIIYPTLSPNFGWEGFGATMKVGITYENGTPVPGKPVVLWGKGSFTGGLSYDKRYLCGGGGTVAMLDLTGNGKPDTVTSFGQACNVSISSSKTASNRTMYLTMGGTDPNVDGGKSWKQWQFIFISDISKKVVRYYKYPSVFKVDPQTSPVASYKNAASSFCWHHPEWSNHPGFATATLNINRYFNTATEEDPVYETTEFQERLFLINLDDSAYLEILRPSPEVIKYQPDKFNRGSGIYWPWFWVDTLKNSVAVNTPRYRKRSVSAVELRGTKIIAAAQINNISVYDISGRHLRSMSPSPASMTVDISALYRVAPGLTYLRIRLVDGTTTGNLSVRCTAP